MHEVNGRREGRGRRTGSRFAAAAGLLFVLLFAPGCPVLEWLTTGSYHPYAKNGAPDASLMDRAAGGGRAAGTAGALTLLAPKGARRPNAADLRLPCDLVPPFRVECTVGFGDAASRPAEDSYFGLNVVDRGGFGYEYSLLCVRADGIRTTAGFGFPVQVTYPGAEQVDLAYDHDGNELVAYVREHGGAGTWVEVTRTAVASAGPFIPKFSALNLDAGRKVIFRRLRVLANAEYAAEQATPELLAARRFAEALQDLADGADALNAETPDTTAATTEFESAGQRLSDAMLALETPVDPGKQSSAARRLRKARKSLKTANSRLTQALGKLSSHGIEKRSFVLRRVGAAAVGVAQAGEQVIPDELRAATNGLTLKKLLRK